MSAAEVIALHSICMCGEWSDDIEQHAAHMLDALKAAGYAVVDLPEPTVDDEWRDELLDWSVWPRRAFEADNALIVDASSALRPDNARRFAAALLAAADAADACAEYRPDEQATE